MTAYYNEIDPYAAQWLRNLIAAGHIAAGDVDIRSITDVRPDDLAGYRQCHFFAGIGGWALATRLAGWPDDREIWTGSCPCQPFSVAGKGAGAADARHLWPDFHRLIRARRPPVVMGEQVAAAVGKDWLDGVFADMEGIGYACRAAVVPACAVNAPHRRDRLWFVADTGGEGLAQRTGQSGVLHAVGGQPERQDAADDHRAHGAVANSNELGASEGWKQRGGKLGRAGGDPCSCRRSDVAYTSGIGLSGIGWGRKEGASECSYVVGHDGKARRIESGIRLLAHGVPARVGKLRAYGNAIVPEVAAEVIGAWMDCTPETRVAA